MRSLPSKIPSLVERGSLSSEDCLLVLADLIVDSYLEDRKNKHIEIEANQKKDYHKDALNLRKGPF
jgi:hypothetical protein